MNFSKYQACGNDFILISNLGASFDKENTFFVSNLCDRHLGIGADGLILVEKNPDGQLKMIYFNADGNIGSFCGNGSRAFLAFCFDLGIIELGQVVSFFAYDGLHQGVLLRNEAEIGETLVEIKMADVDKITSHKSGYILDTGSLHYVLFRNEIETLDVFREGRSIRNQPEFKEAGINVNFVSEKEEDQIAIKTYERGVENETLACGTGCVAAALAFSARKNIKKPVYVQTKGGELLVEFRKKGDLYFDIRMTGPAVKVFEGHF